MSKAHERVDIAANVAGVLERIARAAERSGRSAADVTLVAVAKLVEADRVREICAAGVRLAQEGAAGKALVAGSVGPLGVLLEPLGKIEHLARIAKRGFHNNPL